MNDAHVHLFVNHFPICGTILGLGILIASLVLKNKSVQNTAYVLFVIAAIFGFFSMFTGEGAEEMVEDFPGIGKAIIHEHEELAEKLVIVLYLLGAISVLGIILNIKNHAKAKFISVVAVIIAIPAVYVSILVGTSGGEIRHTEIRENYLKTTGSAEETSPRNSEIKSENN
ncbi:hypothetical protein [Flavobacterium sp. XS2P14]|uniref:hypothetical protein n=1 Tax=Flavobacterium sp. XS2P14 TaxID=3401735 RepID=UPI003AAA9F51